MSDRHDSICRKKAGQRPETATLSFFGCNRLQCAGSAQILPGKEIFGRSKRVAAENSTWMATFARKYGSPFLTMEVVA